VQSSRSVVHGPITWGEFVIQFERRLYPIAFIDKMKTQLERCHQGKKTVAEYEVEFNQIVCFVPHVAHNEYEKARIFPSGLEGFYPTSPRCFCAGVFPLCCREGLGC
jgi:hypothetical protein